MRDERNRESAMEETGLGLLPGVVMALFIVVLAMALLLTGSMWAVVGVLLLIGAVTASFDNSHASATCAGGVSRRAATSTSASTTFQSDGWSYSLRA